MAAGEELGVVAVAAEQRDGVVDGLGPFVVEGGGDHERASCLSAFSSDHTRSGVAGMSTSVMP